MAYGVMFTVEKDYPTSSRKFKELLNAINVENIFWKITESDFHNTKTLQNILEKDKILSGEEVLKELNCEVMMIWIALEGYKCTNEIGKALESFQEYLESNCETAVFIVDTYMFSVYSKNKKTLEKAVDYAKSNNSGSFCLIEENGEKYFGI